jgi:uncharacterized membrane protein
MVAALKALHLAALILWCAGLLALPLLLARHDPHQPQSTTRGCACLPMRASAW